MTTGRFKSRTFRRIKITTPGGKHKIHYRKRKPSIAKCGVCKTPLKGLPRERSRAMKNTAKSRKTVERPYGGNLCSSCMRSIIKRKGRRVFA